MRSLLSEPSRSTTRAVGKPEASPRRSGLDRDEIAILRIAGRTRQDREFAADELLVDRREPTTAIRQLAEDSESALLCTVDELDDAPGVADGVAVGVRFLDPHQGAVANAGGFALPRLTRSEDADFWRRAVGLFVPFGRNREQFAVAVARDDVGHKHIRQRARWMQLLAAALDHAPVAEFAQHALKRCAVGVL